MVGSEITLSSRWILSPPKCHVHAVTLLGTASEPVQPLNCLHMLDLSKGDLAWPIRQKQESKPNLPQESWGR